MLVSSCSGGLDSIEWTVHRSVRKWQKGVTTVRRFSFISKLNCVNDNHFEDFQEVFIDDETVMAGLFGRYVGMHVEICDEGGIK